MSTYSSLVRGPPLLLPKTTRMNEPGTSATTLNRGCTFHFKNIQKEKYS
jgi:hypothetical protein